MSLQEWRCPSRAREWERAMRVQEVIVRGLSGALTWLQVADILGRSPRSIRRMRCASSSTAMTAVRRPARRSPRPSGRRSPRSSAHLAAIPRAYPGFNGRHFYQVPGGARRHAVLHLCQNALAAGRAPGQRPRPRPASAAAEPRPCFGELLHLDGSLHPWLALDSRAEADADHRVDDATKAASVWAVRGRGESVVAVMTALRAVLESTPAHGPVHDRARWAAYTPTSRTNPIARNSPRSPRPAAPGIEHILGLLPAGPRP